MKIALCFSLKLKLFDFTSLRQGQFLANYGKNQKNKSKKKDLSKDTKGYFFTNVIN